MLFQRFTGGAQEVVTDALEYAEARGEQHIGTEHLLIGVVESGGPVASSSLRALGVTPERARLALEELDVRALAAVGVDRPVAIPITRPPRRRRRWRGLRDSIPFTDGAKSCLESSLLQAEAVGDRHIGAEHILLAISRSGQRDPARLVLEELEVDPDELHADMVARIEARRGEG